MGKRTTRVRGDTTPKRKLHGRERANDRVTHSPTMRDIVYMKPERFQDYLTITELSRAVDRSISWLRKLERDGKIPEAHRVKVGQLQVRLWSPTQVDEIRLILPTLKRGRPKKRG